MKKIIYILIPCLALVFSCQKEEDAQPANNPIIPNPNNPDTTVMPIASFTANIIKKGNPLDSFYFTNTSKNASSYKWRYQRYGVMRTGGRGVNFSFASSENRRERQRRKIQLIAYNEDKSLSDTATMEVIDGVYAVSSFKGIVTDIYDVSIWNATVLDTGRYTDMREYPLKQKFTNTAFTYDIRNQSVICKYLITNNELTFYLRFYYIDQGKIYSTRAEFNFGQFIIDAVNGSFNPSVSYTLTNIRPEGKGGGLIRDIKLSEVKIGIYANGKVEEI